jgi:hypothetical protein
MESHGEFAQLYAIARGLTMPLITISAAAAELIDFAGRKFDVSRLAARIRMLKLRLLID